MNNIKIAFFDLDGTLINDDKIITRENINALKLLKEKNIKIVFSSGRWDSFMLEFDKNLNLVDYLITNNGACILDVKNNKVIFEQTLNNNEIKSLINYCDNNNLELVFNGLFKQYKRNDNIDGVVYQSIIICDSIDKTDELIEFINSENSLKLDYISYAYYKKIVAKSYSTNINSINTNKGKSIKYLLKHLNIDKKNSICFGDNYNDLPMFEECGISVAMDNALDKLKKSANYITLSNNENGIAYFINKYIK